MDMMMDIGTAVLALCLVGSVSVATVASGEVRLPHVISSNMVLQRDMELPIWGWAAPGERVFVEIDGQKVSGTADADGGWMVKLRPLAAGGPHEMVVRGKNTITLTNVLVGDVWLCSGQSNMEMGLGVVKNGEQEVAAAKYPKIRLLSVVREPCGQPRADVAISWKECSPSTVSAGTWGGFSAVGYFFGRELHEELDVPIGLIDSTWGGTLIGPWTPREGFEEVAELHDIVEEIDRENQGYRDALKPALDPLAEWVEEARGALVDGSEVPLRPEIPRHGLESHVRPTGLYNGMINPLVPFGLRGAIWYQGESNINPYDERYYEKMKALIGGWRKVWGQGDFPFYYVQLAPFNYRRHIRDFDPYLICGIREAQVRSLSIPNTGMAVTMDVGDLLDIHPANKQEVGHRLALLALAKTYGRDELVSSGPLYESVGFKNGKAYVSFSCVGSGLVSRDGGPLTWFEVAGDDRVFVKAKAEIAGDRVVVWSEEVSEPAAVRYGWHMEAIPNLMNKGGLPASPFSTDRW